VWRRYEKKIIIKKPCNELSKKYHKETMRYNDDYDGDGVLSMKTIFRDGQQPYSIHTMTIVY